MAPCIYATIQAALTTGIATAIATLKAAAGSAFLFGLWLGAWFFAWLTMVPVVIFAAPFIQRAVLAVTAPDDRRELYR